MQWAVLTGDLVDSSSEFPEDIDAAMETLDRCFMGTGRWQRGLTTGYARRGGDGWQAAVSEPRLALRVALYMQAGLRAGYHGDRTTRIAVATGDGILPPDGDTNAASGPAFTDSGRLISNMPKWSIFVHASGGIENALFQLAGTLSAKWSAAEARAVYELLPPLSDKTHRDIASKLRISRRAVGDALARADFHTIKRALEEYEYVR